MKFYCQIVLFLSLSVFSLSAMAQVGYEVTDNCMTDVATAYQALSEFGNDEEVICMTKKGEVVMLVSWTCPEEADIYQDFYLLAAVSGTGGKACRVDYQTEAGNCTIDPGHFRQALQGKEFSAKKRELADFCQGLQ